VANVLGHTALYYTGERSTLEGIRGSKRLVCSNLSEVDQVHLPVHLEGWNEEIRMDVENVEMTIRKSDSFHQSPKYFLLIEIQVGCCFHG